MAILLLGAGLAIGCVIRAADYGVTHAPNGTQHFALALAGPPGLSTHEGYIAQATLFVSGCSAPVLVRAEFALTAEYYRMHAHALALNQRFAVAITGGATNVQAVATPVDSAALFLSEPLSFSQARQLRLTSFLPLHDRRISQSAPNDTPAGTATVIRGRVPHWSTRLPAIIVSFEMPRPQPISAGRCAVETPGLTSQTPFSDASDAYEEAAAALLGHIGQASRTHAAVFGRVIVDAAPTHLALAQTDSGAGAVCHSKDETAPLLHRPAGTYRHGNAYAFPLATFVSGSPGQFQVRDCSSLVNLEEIGAQGREQTTLFVLGALFALALTMVFEGFRSRRNEEQYDRSRGDAAEALPQASLAEDDEANPTPTAPGD
jgi:hypothetical protein